jgi:hypothetical protein
VHLTQRASFFLDSKPTYAVQIELPVDHAALLNATTIQGKNCTTTSRAEYQNLQFFLKLNFFKGGVLFLKICISKTAANNTFCVSWNLSIMLLARLVSKKNIFQFLESEKFYFERFFIIHFAWFQPRSNLWDTFVNFEDFFFCSNPNISLIIIITYIIV